MSGCFLLKPRSQDVPVGVESSAAITGCVIGIAETVRVGRVLGKV